MNENAVKTDFICRLLSQWTDELAKVNRSFESKRISFASWHYSAMVIEDHITSLNAQLATIAKEDNA